MNTSQKTPFLSEVLDGDKISIGTLSYFRERFRDRLYDVVLDEFFKQEEETGLTRAEVARRIGRRPEQITRWFGAPGNWTLETVSDLLLAITKSEPDVNLLPLEGRLVRNYRPHTIQSRWSAQQERSWPVGSAIEANNAIEAINTPVDISAKMRLKKIDKRGHTGGSQAIHEQERIS